MCLTPGVWGGKKGCSMCTRTMRFLRFLCLEFMPGFKHFREDSLKAPRGCQNASWQMGCNTMTWCKQVGGHGCAACHGPDTSCTHNAPRQQPCCCALPAQRGERSQRNAPCMQLLISPSIAVNDRLERGLQSGWNRDLLKFPSSGARSIYPISEGPHLPGNRTV